MLRIGIITLTLAAISYTADPTQTCSDGKQTDYRGTKSTTRGGLTCQAWASQTPHKHTRTPDKYPSLEENYCRNPDNEPAAWCYTTSSKRWDVCGVPTCAEQRALEVLETERAREEDVFLFGESKRATVTLEGAGVKLTTREDLGSFYCGGTCEWVFTTDIDDDALWNIISFKQDDYQCYKIEKASGYHAGESMAPGTSTNDLRKGGLLEGEFLVQTDRWSGTERECWEFVPVDGEEGSYKIRKRFGSQSGKFLSAPPVTFKDADVPKTRRFVRVSSEDSDNVWKITTV